MITILRWQLTSIPGWFDRPAAVGHMFATTPSTGITPFMTLIDQIMTQGRYSHSLLGSSSWTTTAPTIVGRTAIKRLRDRYLNCIHDPQVRCARP